MRASIEFYVSGESIPEVKKKALLEWQRVSDSKAAALPQATEIRMLSTTEEDKKYMAYVVIKTKIEE